MIEFIDTVGQACGPIRRWVRRQMPKACRRAEQYHRELAEWETECNAQEHRLGRQAASRRNIRYTLADTVITAIAMGISKPSRPQWYRWVTPPKQRR